MLSETGNTTYLTRKPAIFHDIEARDPAVAEEEEELQVRNYSFLLRSYFFACVYQVYLTCLLTLPVPGSRPAVFKHYYPRQILSIWT